MVVLGGQLDLTILEHFSNLYDSRISMVLHTAAGKQLHDA